MANPDIVDVATINAESVAFTLTATTTTTLLTVSADVVLKINSIHAANDDGTNDATIDLSVVKANFTSAGVSDFDTSGTFVIAKTIPVPADTALSVLDKPIYLMESDVLKGGASAANDIDILISYEVINDA
jgi:hypothetical protein